MEYEKVTLIMDAPHPIGKGRRITREVVPTGNWRIECRGDNCKLCIGVHGKTLAVRDKKVPYLLFFTRTVSEHYTLDVEKFISEEFLRIDTVSKPHTCGEGINNG